MNEVLRLKKKQGARRMCDVINEIYEVKVIKRRSETCKYDLMSELRNN